MNDVLVLTIPLRHGMGYPSANRQGKDAFRGGGKSDAYRALAFDVEEAAKAAVDAGWETIAYPCRVSITYYRPDRQVVDAANIGSAECNALTRAGIWTDDELARPILLDYQPGDPGPARVVVIVQRLAPPLGIAPRVARPRRNAVPAAIMPAAGQNAPGGPEWPKGTRVPTLNGRPITMADAIALVQREGSKRG
jgi:hypothetical protein